MSTTSLVIHAATQKDIENILTMPPHALLVIAPRGAGKQTIAEYIAGRLLDTPVDRLGSSAACLTVQPVDQVISIEAIRDLQHFMLLKAHKTERESNIQRIAILADAHSLTREAQNALLKTLEEPSAGSMLILTAESTRSLLPTIVSRCQVLTLRKPEAGQIRANASSAASEEHIQLALRISDGWPGLALGMLASEDEHPLMTATGTARGLLQSSQFERLAKVDALSKQREQCEAICFILEQMAHVALQSADNAAIARWQRVLEATHACKEALRARGNTKLVMTQLMLSL